jgi:hypothetical protein
MCTIFAYCKSVYWQEAIIQEKAKLILYEDGKPRDSGGNSRVAMKGGVCVEKFLYYERRQSL